MNGDFGQPHAERPGVVVLMSGGLDSAVLTGLALEEGVEVRPLYIRQGFTWEDEELRAAQRFLTKLGADGPGLLRPLCIATSLAPGGSKRREGRWAVDKTIDVPDEASPDEAVYLPGRNLALLTQAAIVAHAHDLARIQIGVLGSNPFPDATDEFFAAFETVAEAALATPIGVERPLASMSKTDLLRRGSGFALGETLSCLRPEEGLHCGRCNKCAERRRAFADAGVRDPSSYAAVPA